MRGKFNIGRDLICRVKVKFPRLGMAVPGASFEVRDYGIVPHHPSDVRQWLSNLPWMG